MKHKILDKIDNLFKNPENMTMQTLESFIHEMLGFFETLRTTLQKGTEEEKKEAQKTAEEIQARLQSAAQQAFEKTGMSEADIQQFLASGQLPKDELKMFHNAQQEIHDYQKNLSRQDAPKSSSKKTMRHKI